MLWILAPSLPVGALAEPTLNALSAVVMEASTGRILYEKNAYEERPMASTTKIMTLLVALEADCGEELAVVSELAARQPEVHMDMRAGEAYRMRDLYYAMMLESWNDTAVVIAEHISGSVEAFCERMTERAAGWTPMVIILRLLIWPGLWRMLCRIRSFGRLRRLAATRSVKKTGIAAR